MKTFMGKNFLLTNKTACTLFHDYAKDLPILDYHCHVSPKQIAENHKLTNITEAWLGGDHYKWRMLRSHGIKEECITGNATDKEKFDAFARAIPYAIGNPLYHWTHLELQRYFDYEDALNPRTADEVWKVCNEKLDEDSMLVQNIITNSKVEMIGTTDDPTDTLEYHEQLANNKNFKTKVIPTFRPDKAVNIDKSGFIEYIASLSSVSGIAITNLASLKRTLSDRIKFFNDHGCRASDLGLDFAVYSACNDHRADELFTSVLAGKCLTQEECCEFKTNLLLYLAREFNHYNWVMQIHYGAMRSTNKKMFEKLGPDTGFDCISGVSCAKALADFLSDLDYTNELPKTILYSLNANDNHSLASIIGAFQGENTRGKIQHGSAWWFNDTKTGMEEQLTNLANYSLLGNFIGMLTDSRSFLSYTRHEYFRRILCNLIGTWVENGEYPNDMVMLRELVQDICYYNAKRYFGV